MQNNPDRIMDTHAAAIDVGDIKPVLIFQLRPNIPTWRKNLFNDSDYARQWRQSDNKFRENFISTKSISRVF